PYGRSSHSNPPATNPFQWTDPQAEAIARESCYDCHSNETEWWWATNIAPFSWLVQRDVDGGRGEFNFSEWDGQPSVEAIAEAINGAMPPFQYTLIHPGAKLTDAEKRTLLEGYAAGMAASGGQTEATPSATPSATPTSGSSAEAVAIINQRCSISTCHTPDRALAFRASSAAEAQALLDDMIRRGAQVTTEEQQALVQYFTQ
ncbi:MAG TPA: heme-binding domain-containing protein, partial [Thermoleophilia bacterium]|nr:heme-binding domain-containing protein [Thermoleophilia bacterium]